MVTGRLGNGELTINQEFQMIYGTLKTDNNISKITEGRLSGDKITFNVNGTNLYRQGNRKNDHVGNNDFRIG